MKEDRLLKIEQYINSRDYVTIPELIEHFQVSMNTVRRDLNTLHAAGKIKKIYGGAKRLETAGSAGEILTPYAERNVKNAAEKYRIAGKAAEFISEGDTIFIDTGTSTVPLLHHLSSFRHLTVITNSVYALYSALDFPQFTFIGLPGILKHKTASLVGEQCVASLGNYNINKAFMACSAISLTNGVSNSSMEEFSIKQSVLRRSTTHYLLVDASKFNKSSLLTFAELKDFDYIITDQTPGGEYLEYFEANHIKLIVTDESDR